MSNYDEINLVGLEIEGKWQEQPPAGPLMYDGSVEIDGRGGMGRLGDPVDPEGPLIGEAVSNPMPPDETSSWLKRNYPYVVNQTCGLHVHLSTTPPNFQLMMDRKFYDSFMETMKDFGNSNPVPDRFWNRLRGNNDTCQDNWQPDWQLNGGHGTRYTIWNFHAYREHGTVECRVLPAFDEIPLACKSVNVVVDFVCDYLANTSPSGVSTSIGHPSFEPVTSEL